MKHVAIDDQTPSQETIYVELRDVIRRIMMKLNKEKGLKKGRFLHHLPGGMQPRLVRYGYPQGQAAEYTLLLKALGLIHLRQRGRRPAWEILDLKCVVEFIKYDSAITQALYEIKQHKKLVSDLRKTRQAIVRLLEE